MADHDLNSPDRKSAVDGDRFVRLMMDSQQRIYAFVLSLVCNKNDADDIFQDTVSILWRRFDEYKNRSDFAAWGVGIARNHIRRYLEARNRSRILFDDRLLDKIDACTYRSTANINERISALRECLQKLPAQERTLLQMRYEDNIPAQKLADMIGKSMQTVYRSLARIHTILGRCMRKTLST